MGQSGADTIFGGDRRDRIDGGGGDNVVFGGASSDYFYFRPAFDAANTDVLDYKDGTDKFAVYGSGLIEYWFDLMLDDATETSDGLVLPYDRFEITLRGMTLAQFDIGDLVAF